MKKQLFLIGLMAMSMSFTACNKDDDNNGNGNGNTIPEGTADVTIQENNIDVTSQNIMER